MNYQVNKFESVFELKPLSIQFAYLSGLFGRITGSQRESRALILPPTDSGSLGDQAMVRAVIENLRAAGYKKITLIAYASEEDCQKFYEHGDVFVFSGLKNFIVKAKNYSLFYCLGADVMDGFYSEQRSLMRFKLAFIASKMGLKSSILGFSFNASPKSSACDAIKAMPKKVRLFARDPISYERLHQLSPKSLDLAADLAFLLEPEGSSDVSQAALSWIQHEKHANVPIIGVNVNCKVAEKCPNKSNEELISIFCKVLNHMHEKHSVSFMLIPHDFRSKDGILSDVEFCQKISSLLPKKVADHTYMMPPTCTAKDIKYICGKIDFVLTGRMHLAIAALGQGTPPATITYQGKFEGLFQHFQLRNMTLNPETGFNEDCLFDFLESAFLSRDEVAAKIDRVLPRIRSLSRTNLI